jgi:hypothetical protein
MLWINLVIIFYFTLSLVFLLLIYEMDQIVVKFDTSKQHAEAVLFFKACLFFSPGWRVDFTILNWRKTDKKHEMALI